MGIDVKEKVRRHQETDKGHYYSRADWDVGMAVDIIDAKFDFDTVVIGTNDGDFIPVINKLKEYGVRVEIMAYEKHYNKYLKNTANKVYFIRRKSHLIKKRKEDDRQGQDRSQRQES